MSDMSVLDIAVPASEKKVSDKKLKIIFASFVVLCIALFVEVVIYKIVLPSIGTPKIMCSGINHLTTSDIASCLSPMKNANWFTFQSEQAVSILSSYSGVDSVTVTKKFPNSIYISIVEREAVAMTFVQSGGKSFPIHIDKNGVLFSFSSNVDIPRDGSIPIISGLPIEHMSEGMRVPLKYRALIEQIADIQKLQQKYFAAVAEICVVPKEYGNYELVLIPVKTRTRVLTDRALNEDALQYMMVVLDVVNSIEPNVSEIDLRYGSVSYRKRDAASREG
ncbi:MAG: FtsQ-type POTRA domain-containing protein [Treponema sp.]|nr:FtsQ-type POTRA domain-containing protein [Treponema sp.]